MNAKNERGNERMELSVDNGKYTFIFDEKTGNFEALRYGEEWRSLVGDGAVLALLQHAVDLESETAKARSLLVGVSSVLDNLHCGDTKVCREIDDYLYGSDEDE